MLEKNKLLNIQIKNLMNLVNKLEIQKEKSLFTIENEKLDIQNLEEIKKTIIDKFNTNVKNKEIIFDNNHCGSEGHWLEKQFGISHNSKNEPDICGYEMKKESSKISFGDFSATEYLFSKNKKTIEKYNNWDCNKYIMTRIEFIRTFGQPNKLKNNRYSWSGKCIPKYNIWNTFGQILKFNENLDLCIYYSFEKDTRKEKINFPDYIKTEILITIWKKEKLQNHINNKFNKNGFFICKKINSKFYNKICFGKSFNFIYFVDNIKNNNIIFDSGMYETNSRNYSQFRSNINFWNTLITEEY